MKKDKKRLFGFKLPPEKHQKLKVHAAKQVPRKTISQCAEEAIDGAVVVGAYELKPTPGHELAMHDDRVEVV